MSSQNSLQDDIVAKVSVGTTSTAELDDIRNALEELLRRLTSEEIDIKCKCHTSPWSSWDYEYKLFKLKVSKLQPCGSMQEGTSQWKSARYYGRERKFIEFDYLAVLNNKDNLIDIREGGCKGCRELYSSDQYINNGDFEIAFLDALYERINSQCRCIVEDLDCYSSQPDQQGTSHCSMCTAERKTGFLQIAKAPGFGRWQVKWSEHCSIVFLWTSHTGTLLAPNVSTLQHTEIIKRLVIRTDFLPAWEISNDSGVEPLLVVPKRCSQYDTGGTWLVSYCMYELKAIKELSDYHRNCYSIIKFLYGQFTYWCGSDEYLKSYHAKVAFLTHCETCQAASGEYTNCVINILQSLVKTYETNKLQMPEFHAIRDLRVLGKWDDDDNGDIKRSLILFLIDSMHKWTTNSNMTYPEIIKDTVRQIIEEGVWITTTSDGKARLEKQCNMPSSTIRQSWISSDIFERHFDIKAVVNKHVKRCGCSYEPSVFRFHAIDRKIYYSKVPEELKQDVECLENYYFQDPNSPLKTISQSITDSEMTTSTTSDSGGDPEGTSDLILDSDLNVSWFGVKTEDIVLTKNETRVPGWQRDPLVPFFHPPPVQPALFPGPGFPPPGGPHLASSPLVLSVPVPFGMPPNIAGPPPTVPPTYPPTGPPPLAPRLSAPPVKGLPVPTVKASLAVPPKPLSEAEFLREKKRLIEEEAKPREERSDIKHRLPGSSNIANPSDSIHAIYSKQELPEKQEQEHLQQHLQQLQKKLKQLQEQQKEIEKEQQLVTARLEQLHYKHPGTLIYPGHLSPGQLSLTMIPPGLPQDKAQQMLTQTQKVQQAQLQKVQAQYIATQQAQLAKQQSQQAQLKQQAQQPSQQAHMQGEKHPGTGAVPGPTTPQPNTPRQKVQEHGVSCQNHLFFVRL